MAAAPAPAAVAAESTAALPQANYHRDVVFAPDADNVAVEIARVVRAVVPAASEVPAANMVVSEIVGGITNALYRVKFNEFIVRVRIFGGEGMIDRDLETATYCALVESGLAPAYHGRFVNGRIEGWIDNVEPLSLDMMATPDVAAAVARELAKLHGYQLPESLQRHYAEPGMWAQLGQWHEQAKCTVATLGSKWGLPVAETFDAQVGPLVGANFERSTAELALLEAAVPKDAVAAFCHNDLLCGNILRNPATGQLHLIDYEYGGCNYRGFDIANHWNEYAGGTKPEHNGVCEYDRFPSAEQQAAFCRAYLEQLGGHVTDATVNELVKEAQKFVLVNHWYWGLWGVNQAVLEGIDAFNYVQYAASRFAQYYAVKERFLA